MRMEAFVSFNLNQDGVSTMSTYVGIYPCDASCKMCGSCWSIRMCEMMFLTAAEHRCIKSMPKMAHAPDKVRTPEEQFLRKLGLFNDPPRCFSCHHCPSCDAATLIFGSDSKVAPNTHLFTSAVRNQETWP